MPISSRRAPAFRLAAWRSGPSAQRVCAAPRRPAAPDRRAGGRCGAGAGGHGRQVSAMSVARPPEGAHTGAEGAGIEWIVARPPEGARTVAEGADTPVNAIDLLAERANKTCADGHFD